MCNVCDLAMEHNSMIL